MVIQFVLTVTGGKYLIARAISELPEVKNALQHGKLVLKGGTTVSCISEILFDRPLRICGRITGRGAVSSSSASDNAHTLAAYKGKLENIDSFADKYMSDMGPGDVIVTGANIIDSKGNAAMLAGNNGGGLCGIGLTAAVCEGAELIIAAGLEKLIPGSVEDSVRKAWRKGVDYSYGMACGLIPLTGRIITELEAVELLTGIRPVTIGKGGLFEGTGATLFQAEGSEEQTEKLQGYLKECENARLSGDEESLRECTVPSPGCRYHLSCLYRSRKAK